MRLVMPNSRPRSHTDGSPFLNNTVWSKPYTVMSLTTLSATTMFDRTLHGHRPAGAQRGDLVAGAHHSSVDVVAVQGLLDADTRDVGVALDVATDHTGVGA